MARGYVEKVGVVHVSSVMGLAHEISRYTKTVSEPVFFS